MTGLFKTRQVQICQVLYDANWQDCSRQVLKKQKKFKMVKKMKNWKELENKINGV